VRLGDPTAAYLILLDRTGKVAWRYAGRFEDRECQALSCTRQLQSCSGDLADFAGDIEARRGRDAGYHLTLAGATWLALSTSL
jgi:hypothetical protein